MSRIFTLDSPFGDQLIFRRLTGNEGLSEPFELTLDALAESHSLPLQSLLGKPVTIEIEEQGGQRRYLNGLVARALMGGREADRHYRYELTLRPWLWLATRRADCRIFQLKSTPQIVQEVLAPYGFPLENRLACSYPPREYCVQYNETDAAFVSRLMEFEGIYYYFEHASGRHTLVLSDAPSAHRPLPGYESIPFIGPDRIAIADEEHIAGWWPAQEIHSGRHELNDYDFKKPRADLLARRADPLGYSHDDLPVFEWPGGYVDGAQGERYSRVRLEELQAEHDRASGYTNARAMAPVYLFNLTRCPRADQNREYLVVRCRYLFQENAYATKSGDSEVTHETQFIAQPSSLPYRAPRLTPRPRTNGPQTAVVTGPAGEEIWTDQYGRVKLQFHWDRYGRRDENSSCWVRVSNPWAGGGFGGIQIPRVGDEVVVDFLNGDPDHPMVTGRVYNAERMPPWGLPASATQSGLLSRSTPGGTVAHANALRFEDRKGAEQLWMHAERNFDAETEQDHTLSIGHNHTHSVGNDETMQVTNNRKRSVGQNETVSIGQHRMATIGGNETHTVAGSRQREVGQAETVKIGTDRQATIGGSHTETVVHNKTATIGQLYHTTTRQMKTTVAASHIEEIGERTSSIAHAHVVNVGAAQSVNVGSNHTMTVGKRVLVSAGDELALVCGSASITLKNDGTIQIIGVTVESVGSSSHSIRGTTVTSSATGEHTVEGVVLKLNP
jgi:type VI secretion system secreted protein VgrG